MFCLDSPGTMRRTAKPLVCAPGCPKMKLPVSKPFSPQPAYEPKSAMPVLSGESFPVQAAVELKSEEETQSSADTTSSSTYLYAAAAAALAVAAAIALVFKRRPLLEAGTRSESNALSAASLSSSDGSAAVASL